MTQDDIARFCIEEPKIFQDNLNALVMDLPIYNTFIDDDIDFEAVLQNVNTDCGFSNRYSCINVSMEQFEDLISSDEKWEYFSNGYMMTDEEICCDYFSLSNRLLDQRLGNFFYNYIVKCNYIRRNHAERLQRKILKFDPTTDPVIPDRLNKSVVKACVLHGEDFEEIMKQLSYECKGFGNTTIHPRFAAAMLRMGDMLDLDNNRFNPRAINRFGPLPYVSLLHFQKHRAMTHISISPSMIEVVAESPDDDTCSVANEWLTALSGEVKDLICHWNQIVPKELKGCILNTCSTIVYLVDSKTGNKVPYASNPASEFEVNKSKLLELMVGLNLYTSRMDFLREYIQNALDASKMQLWLDIKSGKYSYSDSLNHEVGVYSISPFDIGNDIYENYTIQVSIGYIQSSNKVLIIFSDQGIGMEKDCIEALGKVGSGWRLRKRYNEDLAKMPRWLRPTGGFGIGVQSAFMVADSIRIITFNQFDENGADITMTSPRKKHKDSGKVIYKKLGFIGKGTNIALEINADEFYRNNQDYYDLSQENAPTEIKKWQTEENSKRYSRWVERMFDPLGAMSNTDGNEKGDSTNKTTTNKESSNNNNIVNSDNNNINQKNENSNNSQTVDPFDEIKWLDPFSKEKAIKEIVSFVTKYIETIVPFSPFPIRIVDVSKNIINLNPSNTNSTNFITVKAQDILSYVSKGIEQRTVSSLYLPKWKYWTYMFSEKASNAAKTNSSKQQFWATNCSQNGNEYLVLNECDNSIMLTKTFVWDKNNQIAYCVIPISSDNKLSIDNVICFKNILVKEERVPDWSANKSFAIFTSFDGFNAERIIKIHREAFKETFSMQELPKFINDGYRAAFSVIGKLRKIGLIKCTQFSAVDSFVFRYAILKMPDVFDKESDNDTAELETCSAFEHRDYNRIQKRSIPLWQILNMIEKMMKSTDDGLFLYFEPETVKKYNMKENTCLGQNILRLLEGRGAAEQQIGIDDKNSNSSKRYESSDLEEARKNEIEKYGGVLRSIIFALDKEYVYLFEKKTSSILSEIYGVKIEYFKINN